jgi:hypothetical protein
MEHYVEQRDGGYYIMGTRISLIALSIGSRTALHARASYFGEI